MSLTVPMITRGALGRDDLMNDYGSANHVRPPINDLTGLMSGAGGMMGSPMGGGSMINSSSVGGFAVGAAVGAVAAGAMQNGGLNGSNFLDHPQGDQNNGFNGQPQNGYPNNGMNNQPQNGYPNNGFNNQPQNGYPNNGMNNQPQNGYPNNGFNNQPQNGYPNNGFNNQPQNGYPNNGFNDQSSGIGFGSQPMRNGDPLNDIFAPPPQPVRSAPQNPGQLGQNSWEPVRNSPTSGQGSYGVQQPVSAAPASYASNPQQARPVLKRSRVQPTGDRLAKGQKYSIRDRDGKPVTQLKICLGWDVKDGRCELDASAFMLGSGGRVPGDEWFIFYGQPDSPDNGVHYKVFKDDPRSPDDAAVDLDLDRVDQRVEKIALAVTIYEASRNALHFGMVQDLYARIVDRRTNREIASFKMDECYSTVTAMVLGELYRYKGEWKFNAVGSGVNKDLAEFCGMYGVQLE